MKLWHWLTLSLAINVVLAFAALRHHRPAGGPPHLASMTNRNIRVTRPAYLAAPASPVTVEVSEPFHWSQLESEDYRVYAAGLRGIGCPEQTVRDIIIADVRELFDRRVRDLVDPVLPRFWELISHKEELEKLTEEKEAELERLAEEAKALLQEVLGPGGRPNRRGEQALEEARLERRQCLSFLPADKIDGCLEIEDHFTALRETAGRERRGEEFRAELKRLEAEQEQTLSGLMSPEEYAEYRLRNSRFASSAVDLKGFEASESELKEIVRLQDELARSAELKERNVDVRIAQRGEAEKEMQEKLKGLLGGDRFAEYQRARDQNYQELLDLTSRLQMPVQAANDVYSIRRQVEAQMAQLRGNAGMSPDQRADMMSAIRAETEGSIADALGPQAYELYVQHYGSWIPKLGVQPAASR